MPEPSVPSRPIISEFADDPDMQELVQIFASEMPGKIAGFEQALAGQRLDELRRLAHQLKGAAGGYGFGVVGDAAGRLESRLQSAADGSAAVASIEQVRRDVEEVLALCRSVRAAP
ncbi:MAG: Hpt domain-containing protein [Phycisphaerales bacterium]|nr:Hpt domain-containing protein [Phycisphaerales bacterium]